ncbi:MAG: HpsJ family protein [Thermosynechococcaceae cyanobacterium]
MQDSSELTKGSDYRTQWLSTFSLRLTGYVLLALAALDIVAVVFPTDFFNPEWEFKTIGSLVERVPVPLIGLALVFYGGLRYRRPLEKLCLRPFALLAIIAGIGYLLLVPLSISNSFRVNKLNHDQQTQQLEQQLSRFGRLEQQLSSASPEQLVSIMAQLNLPVSAGNQDLEAQRAKAFSQVKKTQEATFQQSQAQRKLQKQQHLKNSVKWVLGALLSGTCLIYLGMGANKFFLLGLD